MEIVYFRLDPLNTLAYVVSLLTSLDFIRGIGLDDKLVSGKKDTDLSVILFSDHNISTIKNLTTIARCDDLVPELTGQDRSHHLSLL